MGDVRLPDPALLVVAVCSRHADAIELGQADLEKALGPVGLCSLPYPFVQTSSYETTMGPGLRKHFLAFERLIVSDRLISIKQLTNQIEADLARSGKFAEPRPLNLDPGILTLGKFLLATTKDQAHRIYLGLGIFAEVTLRFEQGEFVPWPWTYADYRQACVLDFLAQARGYYRERLRASREPCA